MVAVELDNRLEGIMRNPPLAPLKGHQPDQEVGRNQTRIHREHLLADLCGGFQLASVEGAETLS